LNLGIVAEEANPTHIDCNRTIGYDTGDYKQQIASVVRPANRNANEKGVYLVVIKKISGHWKIVQHFAVPTSTVLQ